jgi:hypothetical protein
MYPRWKQRDKAVTMMFPLLREMGMGMGQMGIRELLTRTVEEAVVRMRNLWYAQFFSYVNFRC